MAAGQGLALHPCYRLYTLCWLCFRETVADIVEGFEQAWAFCGGLFPMIIPNHLKAVSHVDRIAPRFNPCFLEYAQARGFPVDPARTRRPPDKTRVRWMVTFCRNSGFRGEHLRELPHARDWVAESCRTEAGLRIHRTTQRRPREQFEQEQQPLLYPAADDL